MEEKMKNIKIVKIITIIILLTAILLTLCMPIVTYSAAVNPDNFDPSKNNPITKSDYSGVMAQTKTIFYCNQNSRYSCSCCWSYCYRYKIYGR